MREQYRTQHKKGLFQTHLQEFGCWSSTKILLGGYLSYKNGIAPRTRFEWDSGGYCNFIKNMFYSHNFPTFTNKNSFLAETWCHSFLAGKWRFGEWVKEIYWVVKNIWSRSCLVFTSLAHKHSCSLPCFISVNHCDRHSEFPSSACPNNSKIDKYFDAEPQHFSEGEFFSIWNIPWDLFSGWGAWRLQWYFLAGSAVRKAWGWALVWASGEGERAKTLCSMLDENASSRCAWLFLPDENSENNLRRNLTETWTFGA